MMHRARVDFPHPVSPTSPSVSPRRTSMLTPSTALTLPTWCLKKMPSLIGKCLTMPSARTRTSPPSAGSGIDRRPLDGGDDARKLCRPHAPVRARVALARRVHGDADAGHIRREPACGGVVGAGRDRDEVRL